MHCKGIGLELKDRTRSPESALLAGSAEATVTSWGRWARRCFLSHRYEEEINKRTVAENDFVVLKKVKGLSPTSHPRAPLNRVL